MRVWSAVVVGALLFSGAAHAEKPAVVTTFSILADLTQRVAGDHVEVVTLVGPDEDAHVFEPGPRESAKLAGARLLIANGAGFEPWLARLTTASGFAGTTVIATDGVTLRPVGAHDDHAEGEEHGEDEGHDPHAFQDLATAQIYVANIARGLSEIDPAHASDFAANATALTSQMQALDQDLKDAFAAIPEQRRRVLTSHDAFGYFAAAYGITFVAVQGVSTEAEPSAADLAKIVRQARDGKVTAIFLENMADPRLAETVAQESGVKIGGALYADALSQSDGPAPDYLSLIRHNAKQLLDALR
jgi:zinc/manganese transport system substrate-binding protein